MVNRGSGWVVVATALVVGVATASAAVDPLSTVSGPSPFVKGCADAPSRDLAFGNSEVEPFVAVNPTRPLNAIAVWQQDRRPDGGSRGTLVATTEDGGRSWAPSIAPTFSRCVGGTDANGGAYRSASDPWVSFGPDGVAYAMSLAVDTPETRDAMLAATSKDGGKTWGSPVVLAANNDVAFNDKNSLIADPTRPGVAYAVWNEAFNDQDRARTVLTRTFDGGTTWEAPRILFSDPLDRGPVGHQIDVLSDGTLVMVFVRQGQLQPDLVATRSTDMGQTWSAPSRIVQLSAFLGFVGDPRGVRPVRSGDGLVPDIAVDPRNGAVYVVWGATSRLFRAAIRISRSVDGGVTWSTPRRVSQNRKTQAFTPSVAVNANGRVAVTYYDFTGDTIRGRPLVTSSWVATSDDGGNTFAPRRALRPRPFDLRGAPQLPRGWFLGDYQGLAAMGNDFLAVFTTVPGRRGDRTRIVATTIR